jgi:hypothetical protein
MKSIPNSLCHPSGAVRYFTDRNQPGLARHRIGMNSISPAFWDIQSQGSYRPRSNAIITDMIKPQQENLRSDNLKINEQDG